MPPKRGLRAVRDGFRLFAETQLSATADGSAESQLDHITGHDEQTTARSPQPMRKVA